ncbi:hypothetical protein MPC1_2340003 [Methylocella tundrae]|nr:hypothetical protein MPC1_2340003 [Methylocella tundrae]
MPRFRASRRCFLPLHEYSGALRQRISWRHRRSAGSRADGLQRLVRSLSRRPLDYLRRAPQYAAHRPYHRGAGTGRHRYSARDLFWPAHSQGLSRLDGRSRRNARPRPGTAKRLERFPIEWSHSIDQKSLQTQKLEHILVDQIDRSDRNVLQHAEGPARRCGANAAPLMQFLIDASCEDLAP